MRHPLKFSPKPVVLHVIARFRVAAGNTEFLLTHWVQSTYIVECRVLEWELFFKL